MRASTYSPDFREHAGRLARESQRLVSAVARDLVAHPGARRVWVRQDEADDGSRTQCLSIAERGGLTALHRENRELRRSDEVLRAASVYSGCWTRWLPHATSGRRPGGPHTVDTVRCRTGATAVSARRLRASGKRASEGGVACSRPSGLGLSRLRVREEWSAAQDARSWRPR
ncbi:MAG: transposase [Armatimonadetes bacterium]|nr:transposase [Armatimonadota bacterium]